MPFSYEKRAFLLFVNLDPTSDLTSSATWLMAMTYAVPRIYRFLLTATSYTSRKAEVVLAFIFFQNFFFAPENSSCCTVPAQSDCRLRHRRCTGSRREPRRYSFFDQNIVVRCSEPVGLLADDFSLITDFCKGFGNALVF